MCTCLSPCTPWPRRRDITGWTNAHAAAGENLYTLNSEDLYIYIRIIFRLLRPDTVQTPYTVTHTVAFNPLTRPASFLFFPLPSSSFLFLPLLVSSCLFFPCSFSVAHCVAHLLSGYARHPLTGADMCEDGHLNQVVHLANKWAESYAREHASMTQFAERDKVNTLFYIR